MKIRIDVEFDDEMLDDAEGRTEIVEAVTGEAIRALRAKIDAPKDGAPPLAPDDAGRIPTEPQVNEPVAPRPARPRPRRRTRKRAAAVAPLPSAAAGAP